VPDIVKGIFYSMVKRVLEMDALTEQRGDDRWRGRAQPLPGEMTSELIERPVRTCPLSRSSSAPSAPRCLPWTQRPARSPPTST
jgi:hypothetical protein